jgi:hypothetical protein
LPLFTPSKEKLTLLTRAYFGVVTAMIIGLDVLGVSKTTIQTCRRFGCDNGSMIVVSKHSDPMLRGVMVRHASPINLSVLAD